MRPNVPGAISTVAPRVGQPNAPAVSTGGLRSHSPAMPPHANQQPQQLPGGPRMQFPQQNSNQSHLVGPPGPSPNANSTVNSTQSNNMVVPNPGKTIIQKILDC